MSPACFGRFVKWRCSRTFGCCATSTWTSDHHHRIPHILYSSLMGDSSTPFAHHLHPSSHSLESPVSLLQLGARSGPPLTPTTSTSSFRHLHHRSSSIPIPPDSPVAPNPNTGPYSSSAHFDRGAPHVRQLFHVPSTPKLILSNRSLVLLKRLKTSSLVVRTCHMHFSSSKRISNLKSF